MLCSRGYLRLSIRQFSNRTNELSRSTNPETSVVFLHHGQPRTEFYAKDFLLNGVINHYGLPAVFRSIIPTSLLVNKKVRGCLNDYGSSEPIENTVRNFVVNVQTTLNELVPEFDTLSCYSAFLGDPDSFKDQIEEALSSGSEHVILFPLSPHFACSQNGMLLNAASRYIWETTVPLLKNGREEERIRARPDSGKSFKVSAVHRWGSHPTISNFWCNKLNSIEDSFEGIVYCAPAMRGYGSAEYVRSVWATCERVSDNLGNAVPWTLGFYNGWDEWNFPLRDSLDLQIKRLVGNAPHQRRVVVVPVTEILNTFNTSVISNRIASNPKVTFCEPSISNPVILQGVSEILKNHLLGRRNVQISQYCRGCIRKDCEYTRSILS